MVIATYIPIYLYYISIYLTIVTKLAYETIDIRH